MVKLNDLESMMKELDDKEVAKDTKDVKEEPEMITEEERFLRQEFGEVDKQMQRIDAKLTGIKLADAVQDLPKDQQKWAIISFEYIPEAIPGFPMKKQHGELSLRGLKDLTPNAPKGQAHEYELDEVRLDKLNKLIAYSFHDVSPEIKDFDSMYLALSKMFEAGETIEKPLYVSSFIDKNNKGSVKTVYNLTNRHKRSGTFIETEIVNSDLFKFAIQCDLDDEKQIVPVVIDKVTNDVFDGEDKSGNPFKIRQFEIVFHVDEDKVGDVPGADKFKGKHYMSKYKYLDENQQPDFHKMVHQMNTISLLLGIELEETVNKTLTKLEQVENKKANMEILQSPSKYNYGPNKGKSVYYAKLI